jgi:hypothetical protein
MIINIYLHPHGLLFLSLLLIIIIFILFIEETSAPCSALCLSEARPTGESFAEEEVVMDAEEEAVMHVEEEAAEAEEAV